MRADVTDEALRLEAALAAAQTNAEAMTKAAATVVRELKKARTSAVTGQVRDLRRALTQAESLAAALPRDCQKISVGEALTAEEERNFLLLQARGYSKD